MYTRNKGVWVVHTSVKLNNTSAKPCWTVATWGWKMLQQVSSICLKGPWKMPSSLTLDPWITNQDSRLQRISSSTWEILKDLHVWSISLCFPCTSQGWIFFHLGMHILWGNKCWSCLWCRLLIRMGLRVKLMVRWIPTSSCKVLRKSMVFVTQSNWIAYFTNSFSKNSFLHRNIGQHTQPIYISIIIWALI